MKPLIIALLFAQTLAAQTLPVSLKRSFWPDSRGELSITEQGIEFQRTNKAEGRAWAYRDIQSFDRISKTEFVILSYEDQRWKLGRDRPYHFKVTSGELSEEVFERIRQRLNKPVTDRVIGEVPNAEYRIPVKHLHSFGGCEGELIFTPEAIYYSTTNKEDARKWRVKEELQSVWSSDPYYLELHVYEDNRREFGQTRVFKFSLKEPLDPEFYRGLKLRFYDLDQPRRRIR